MAEPTSIETVEEFDSFVAKHKYVVVDFWAEWCPPCKAMAPMFANLSKSHGREGQLAFAKIDVDKTPEVAKKYGITAMPSFLFLHDFGKADGIDVPQDGKIAGGGTFMDNGKLKMIRGADPRNLTAVASELGRRVKEAADTAA
ncbi:thioredoxin-like protein [Diplogelasinospora grovesii]|uniref:Thioredoxin-like protein n=1 Tax=Diplogelasinospora grovesii TaxID=303347 RepID=A0AAN6NHU8_9PEZI|nr:thioredoxin-like protein [Diplogelasinospora grovesii]